MAPAVAMTESNECDGLCADDNKGKLMAAGVLDPIMAAMVTHAADPAVMAPALGALRNLAVNGMLLALFVNEMNHAIVVQ